MTGAGQAGLPLDGFSSAPDAAAAAPSATIAGRIAARIDRLPLTKVQWEIAILVELTWGLIIVDTDGIAGRLYPFIWRPHHYVSTFQYSVIQALEVGLGVLIGDWIMSWVADRYGRKIGIVLAAVLGGLFLWPFAYVTSFWQLVALSVFSTLGVGAIVALHSVYISELIGPNARNRLLLSAQSVTALVGVVVGLLAFFWIPIHWQAYVWVVAALVLVMFPLLLWRLPESPRWLEAHGRHDEAERVVEKLEARCQRAYGKELPEPDPDMNPVVMAGKGAWKELFINPEYRQRTILLLISWLLGYPGIVYGVGAFAAVYMVDHGASAHFVFLLITIAGVFRFGGFLANARLGERFERRDVILAVALLFFIGWGVIYFFPTKPVIAIFYVVAGIGGSLWLFNMYNYTAMAFPTRFRAVAFGWTDGLGHLGAWAGITLTGPLYLMGQNHLGWVLFIIVPGALIPSLLVRFLGINQRAAVMEQVST